MRDGRLDLDRVRSMAAPLAAVQSALAAEAAPSLSATREWLLPPVADRLADFQRSVDDAIDEAATASEAVAVLPDLLGGNGRRTYFVAFGTPAETRELGGFMGAYAHPRGRRRRADARRHGSVRDLNHCSTASSSPTRRRSRPTTSRCCPQRFWQNLTRDPGLPDDGRGRAPALAGPALGADRRRHLHGPDDAVATCSSSPARSACAGYDKPLTADTAADFLLREQYVAFPDDDRHDFLVDAATTVFEKLTSGELPGRRSSPTRSRPRCTSAASCCTASTPTSRRCSSGSTSTARCRPWTATSSPSGRPTAASARSTPSMQRTVAYDVVVDPFRPAPCTRPSR